MDGLGKTFLFFFSFNRILCNFTALQHSRGKTVPLTMVGTSNMIPIVYRYIDSYSVVFLLVYRGTWLTFVSWPTSVTWRAIGVHGRQDRMTFFVSQTQPCLGRCHLKDFRVWETHLCMRK